MNKTLNEAVVNSLVEIMFFLEFSDESIVDPDSSIQALETVSYELRSMDTESKILFCEQLKKIARSSSEEKRNFIKTLLKQFELE